MNTDACRLREWILNEIRESWRMTATGNPYSVLGEPPDDITIFEYPRGDYGRGGRCSGEPVPLETVTRQLMTIAPITLPDWEDVPVRSSYYQHAIARLHVDEASLSGLLELTLGPLFGGGYVCRRNENGEFSKKRHWVS